MQIYCPYTVGTSNPVSCNHGNVSGMRCPYWQQTGQVIQVENLMDNPIILESTLCRFIPEIIRDFEVVGNYRWQCTQWPGIREKEFECILQDGNGKKYTVNDVINRYIESYKKEELPIRTEDTYVRGRETQESTTYTNAYY